MQFIPFLIKEGTGIPNVKFMFFLYLVSSVVTYFFAHFQSLIIADQKSYITMINQLIFKVFQSCAQIYVLMNFQSYELYLIIMILCGLGANLNVARIVRNKYPFIIEKSNHKIDKETLVDIKKNVVGTFSGKIGSLVVTSTDNILISKFIGLGMVGLYSNYALITAALTTLLGQAMNSTVASFGNFAVTESKNKQSAMYEVLMCFVSVITISETVAFVLAVQPFITVFFGGDFVLSRTLVCLIAINFGFGSLRSAPLTQISALGVFWHLKYKSIVEAGINLAISLIMIMAFKMGLAGVLIGTICSNVFVNLSWETMVIFRHGFKLSVRRALMKYIGYHALVVGAVLISLKVAASLQVDSVVMIVLLAIAGFTTSLSLLTVAMFNTKEMKFIRDRVLSIVGATS
ncbi:lipopolysaccharide biosynthesis protein [Weissella cibaria]|uniref:lipopolysaccharide biosynthesis protein n=1 Tax=Weissella cibaria TaxID=137591 RepID=UPI00215B5B0D|nr:hypothetical protein [Weissella cibaria]MCR8702353.1 hypothetical protein [Weissella cibaria]